MLWLMLKPLDVIELSVAVDAWEVGTIATVLEVASGSALTEVSDADGRTLDVLTVPLEAARRLEGKMSQDVPRCPKTSRLRRARRGPRNGKQRRGFTACAGRL
jgi:hypothetical protein